MNRTNISKDLFSTVVEYYRPYAERNDTLESFAYDVNTLGGTLERGFSHIDTTTKTHVIVSDWEFKPLACYRLKEIWNVVKGEQQSLF